MQRLLRPPIRATCSLQLLEPRILDPREKFVLIVAASTVESNATIFERPLDVLDRGTVELRAFTRRSGEPHQLEQNFLMHEEFDPTLFRQSRDEAKRNGVFKALAIPLSEVLGVLVDEYGSVNINLELPVSPLNPLRFRNQHETGIDRRL